MSRLKKSAAAAAVFAASITASEGVRQSAYPDPGTHGKPWTICMGATKLENGQDVKPGDFRTIPQCRALLVQQSDPLYADRVEMCTDKRVLDAMPDKRYVAFVSLAYNNGPGTYCHYFAPLLNAGRTREACEALVKGIRRPDGSFHRFDTVMRGKVVLPGLTSRRERERAFCMEGL